MSVIAVKRFPNKIVMSADSQVTFGDHKTQTSGEGLSVSKIYESNNIIVGSSGTVVESNFFRLFTDSHLLSTDTELEILRYLVDFTKWMKDFDSSFTAPKNHYIIVIGETIAQILGLEIHLVESFSAVGSGMWVALGALTQGASCEDAIEAAKKYDLYCGGKTITITKKL